MKQEQKVDKRSKEYKDSIKTMAQKRIKIINSEVDKDALFDKLISNIDLPDYVKKYPILDVPIIPTPKSITAQLLEGFQQMCEISKKVKELHEQLNNLETIVG